jgi:hypothetical protein
VPRGLNVYLTVSPTRAAGSQTPSLLPHPLLNSCNTLGSLHGRHPGSHPPARFKPVPSSFPDAHRSFPTHRPCSNIPFLTPTIFREPPQMSSRLLRAPGIRTCSQEVCPQRAPLRPNHPPFSHISFPVLLTSQRASTGVIQAPVRPEVCTFT